MRIFNTLTRNVEDFKPLHNENVKLYTCGLTVYSHPHIGNWVAYIYWDILQRVLEHNGYTVKRVQNITDVGHLTSDDDSGEDKMQKRADTEGVTAWDIAEKYTAIAQHESKELGLLQPELIKATSCIDEQINFVQKLEDKGFTYRIEGEGIYFDTSNIRDYGKLARLDIQGLDAGARVSVDGKHNPTDFALWKFSPENSKRDMEWDSPWGKGFPGWHLECSVIAHKTLGEHIDIHTGGIDHIPVHHTNEMAQSEAMYGEPFSRYWMHANHIKVDGTKMSKSLGNVYTLEDVKNKGFSIQAFKLLILSKHYQTEGNFSWEILESSQNRLQHWQTSLDLAHQIKVDNVPNDIVEQIKNALNDNLNTPLALRIIDEYIADCEERGVAPASELFTTIENLLGLHLENKDIDEEIKQLLNKRATARQEKNWHESDSIRDELLQKGIGVRDLSSRQLWYRK